MVLVMFTGLTVAFLSGVITLGLAKVLLSRVTRLDYRKLTFGVMTFLIFMVILLSGPAGVVAAITGTLIGIMSIRLGVKRSHMMGFLILPTILYFSGYGPYLMQLLGL